MDIKSELGWIHSARSNELSANILRATPDQTDEHQIRAELRIFLDRPHAIIFANKGLPFAGKNVDLFASNDRRFPRGETYEEIGQQIVEIFNEVTAEARATIVALAERPAPMARPAVDDSPSP